MSATIADVFEAIKARPFAEQLRIAADLADAGKVRLAIAIAEYAAAHAVPLRKTKAGG